MNPSQQAHHDRILKEATQLISAKYTKGTIEHNSNLSEDYTVDQLLTEAINEAIDQITYLLTLKEKLNG